MSKEVTSQKMRATCDACGASKEWELLGAELNPLILDEMQQWYSVQHKVAQDGQLKALQGDACCLACVPAVAVKLALPKDQQDPLTDPINLADLQVN